MITATEKRKGVFLYYDFLDVLKSFSDEQFGKAIRTLLVCSRDEINPDSGNLTLDTAVRFLKTWDDLDKEKYNKILEQRRAAVKKGAKARWETARSGCS